MLKIHKAMAMKGLWPFFKQVAFVLHQEVNFGFEFFLLGAAEFDLKTGTKVSLASEKNLLGFELAGVKIRQCSDSVYFAFSLSF